MEPRTLGGLRFVLVVSNTMFQAICFPKKWQESYFLKRSPPTWSVATGHTWQVEVVDAAEADTQVAPLPRALLQ